jgi:hypothetical protein
VPGLVQHGLCGGFAPRESSSVEGALLVSPRYGTGSTYALTQCNLNHKACR